MWEQPKEHGLPPRHEWTEDEVALLGTDTDSAIAKLLGVGRHLVFEQRRRLGIPRIPNRWTESEMHLLGTATDGQVARTLGRTEHSVRWKRQRLGGKALRGWLMDPPGPLRPQREGPSSELRSRTYSCILSRDTRAGIRLLG